MIFQLIQQLINQVLVTQLIEPEDEVYVRNQVLSLFRITEFEEVGLQDNSSEIPDLLERLVEYAVDQGIIEDLFDEKEIFSSQIMNCFMARPSEVNRVFNENYQMSPEKATDHFYRLSKNSNYIQMKRIRQNIEYKAATEYGELDITINLSKPEKDPKSIELERMAKQSSYPKCLLCIENEGYAGRIGHPARANHRMIRVNLLDEKWFFQYSPYMYYNEHCIVLSESHIGMKISKVTFARLLAFVKQFPHYFLGSNADLPIVGGSILAHEHYQGGQYEFAMAKAESDWSFAMKGFPQIDCAVVKWPMSVIRLRSSHIDELVEAANHILTKWKHYNDQSLEILAWTDTTSHHTITPIARKKGDKFELDLVLRNNRTSEEHPLGIFHPHADVHHIKKENIGLIEVMGLAVLPPRLKTELEEVGQFVLGKIDKVADYHAEWAAELREQYGENVSEANVNELIREEVGKKFLRVLEDAGVFKRDEQGAAGFRRFIETL